MTKRFFVALVTAFILFQILGFQRAQGQSNPDPKLVEGAKKEGQMIFYTTMTIQSKEVVDRFQEKYPFIKPTLFRTGGGPLLNKIFTEARGGRHAWDVVVGRAEIVVPLMQRKLIASYRSPETKMIDEDLVDREGYWSAYYVISYVLGWHTKWSEACSEYRVARTSNPILLGFSEATRGSSKIRKIIRTLKG
jgi:iron(III) transport system substrate-binding protein